MSEPRPYKKRGFGRIGERCPECGGPISHGRSGNPAFQKGPPPCRNLLVLFQQAKAAEGLASARRRNAKAAIQERVAERREASA